MLLHIRRLLSQTLVFGVGDAITRVAALLLLPVYTHVLTPSDYGKLAIVTLVTTIVTLVLDSGQRSAFFKFYFSNESPQARRRLTGTVFIYLFFSAALILALLFLFFERAAFSIFKDTDIPPLIRIALIGAFFDIGSVIPFSTFRAEQRAAQYALLSLLRFSISVILNLLAIVFFRWGVIGVIYANLITSVLFFVICFAMTVRVMDWTLDLNLLKQLLYFGLPLVPANLAGWALTFSDRFFLQKYADISQVGIYAVGYSMAGILAMLTGWFNTAYAPYCFSISNQPNVRVVYARVMTYSITLFTFIGLALAIFAREALLLLTSPAYYAAASIVPLIVLANLFFEINYIISFGLDLTGKTGYYLFIMGAGAIFNLLLNFILIKPFGMMGAAVATLLSYALLPVIEYFIVRNLYPVPYEWIRLLKLALVSIGIYCIGAPIKTGQIAIDLFFGTALLFFWGLILYVWRFFTKAEVAWAQEKVKNGWLALRARF